LELGTSSAAGLFQFVEQTWLGTVKQRLEGGGAWDIELRSEFTGKLPSALKEDLQKHVKSTFGSDSLGGTELGDPLDLKQPFHLRLPRECWQWRESAVPTR